MEQGLPEPSFRETDSSFIVTIKKKVVTEEKLREMNFNERQIKGFKHINKNGSITSTKYAEINDIAKRTARKDLSEMIEKKNHRKNWEG